MTVFPPPPRGNFPCVVSYFLYTRDAVIIITSSLHHSNLTFQTRMTQCEVIIITSSLRHSNITFQTHMTQCEVILVITSSLHHSSPTFIHTRQCDVITLHHHYIISRCLLPERRCPVGVVSRATCTPTWPPSMNGPAVWRAAMAPSPKFPSSLCPMTVGLAESVSASDGHHFGTYLNLAACLPGTALHCDVV